LLPRTYLHLVGYNDADWSGDPDEFKSTSDYAFLLNDEAITWCSKKQTCVALSTMETKYVTSSAAVQEGVWLSKFLREFSIVARAEEPVTIYCDSSAAIAYSKDPKYHVKTKHIDISYHFVSHMIARKEVILRHISTSRMVADQFD